MSKPEDFIINSDFTTLKNDTRGSVTVTFPGSQSIAGSSVRTFQNTIDLGVPGSSVRARITSSKQSGSWYTGSSLLVDRVGTSGGFSATYTIIALLTRTSPTTITVQASVLNANTTTLNTVSGDETFTFYINTFLPPFNA